MRYTVRKIVRDDGKTVFRVYENNNPLEDFLTEERAWEHIAIWKVVMR